MLLPPELWRLIFAHATAAPGVLDLTPLPPLSNEKRAFNYFPDASIGFSALRTKRNLILVCKSWQSLALEFLYTFVWLWKPTELFSLIRSLKLAANVDMTSALYGATYTPGRYIKCLWLSMGAFQPEDSLAMDALQELFNMCHNLQILRVWPGAVLMNFPVIAERSRSLRYAEMEWIRDEDSRTFASSLFESMPQYDVLEALHLTFCDAAPLFPDYPLSLTRLHSFILELRFHRIQDRILGYIALWNLPGLVYLSLLCNKFSLATEQLFRSFGHNLTSLMVEQIPHDVVRKIIRYCPSVQNLFIQYVPQAKPPYSPFPSTPNLRRIQFDGRYMLRAYCDVFMNTVENTYMQNSPALQCIQLLDMTRADWLSNHDVEESGRRKALGDLWLDKGIRFEDQNGVLLSGDSESVVSEPEDERTTFLRVRDAEDNT
jgi:hypothetical protein